jgi:rhomboid protease GluP
MAAAKTDLSFAPLTPQQFLALAADLVRQLEWQLHYISDLGLQAYSGKVGPAWKTDVSISIQTSETPATGLAQLTSQSLGPKNRDSELEQLNIDRFLHQFDILKERFTPEDLDQKYAALQPQLTPKEKDFVFGSAENPAATQQPHKKERDGFFVLFVPRKGYFITPIVVYLNVAVFIAMVASGVSLFDPSIESLISWGANIRPLVLEGAWWRLITNVFLHIGILHLALNMYALLYIGVLLEPLLGELRFSLAYLLTGIMASLASLWWHPLLVSAGASGAIFGMYGVFIALLTTDLIEETRRKALLTSIGIFVAYNLIYGLKGGIDNAAHIGGLLSGLAIGFAFIPGLTHPEDHRLRGIPLTIATLVVLIACTATIKLMPDDFAAYNRRMEDFATHEEAALAFYRLPDDATKENCLTAIRDSGLRNWDQCILLLNEAKKLDLPKNLEDRIGKLQDYCDLRIGSYNYMYRQMQAGADKNTINSSDSINYYGAQIKAILDALKQP